MKDRGFKIMVVAALVIAVLGLTIGYAAYTQTLTINGSAAVTATDWNVKFQNLQNGVTDAKGYGVVTNEAQIVDNTKISGFKATLNAPGASVMYQFDVANTGGLDASLTEYSLGGISCAPAVKNGATGPEASAVCDDLRYTLTYDDGGISTGNVLKAGNHKTLQLKIEWLGTSTKETSGAVDVTIGETKMVYTQVN